MKLRQRQRARARMLQKRRLRPQQTTTADLDEGLTESFPASDPVAVSVTRIDTDNRDAAGTAAPRAGPAAR